MTTQKSVAELMETVKCPRPSYAEHDRQIVELFLQVCHQGRFAKNPGWLPQNHSNVEAIASDTSGARIAIEHTRIFAFEGHKKQEELLRPIAELLEASPVLSMIGVRFNLRFQVPFLGNRLLGKQALVARELLSWAAATLPPLEPNEQAYRFEIPIRLKNGKVPKIDVEVEVQRRPSQLGPVSVSGYLPPGPRLVPLVRKALTDKLLKLSRADAERRALILELPTTDSEHQILETIYSLAPDFRLLDSVDEIVFAKTLGLKFEGVAFFYVWDMRTKAWSQHLEAILDKAS